MPDLKLSSLRIGSCRAPEGISIAGGAKRLIDFPAGVALIRHPRLGTTLFDTGYGEAFFRATARLPEAMYRWLTPVTLAPQDHLHVQLGQTSVDRIFLSHLHADHVAGLPDLDPSIPAYASAQAIKGLELARLPSLKAGCPHILRDYLRGRALQSTQNLPTVDLTGHGLGAFGQGRDLLGDGSALVVPLPGHGIGQEGLFLPRTDLGPCFLVADAAWSLRALRENRPPPKITLSRLGDAGAYLQTFARLVAFRQARPDIRIIAAHCPEAYP